MTFQISTKDLTDTLMIGYCKGASTPASIQFLGEMLGEPQTGGGIICQRTAKEGVDSRRQSSIQRRQREFERRIFKMGPINYVRNGRE